jgi:hypothetical protein
MIRRLRMLPLLVLALALVPAAARGCPAGELPALAVPNGIYHGAFANFSAGARNEDYVTAQRVRRFAQLAGKRLAWGYFSQQFFRGLAFPRAAATTIWRQGAVPVIRLMPWSQQLENSPEPTFTLARIAAGDFDAPLQAWGRDAAASRIPLVVEFGPEVNGDWFPWNGLYNGGPGAGPAIFRAAFQRVVDDIRSGGVRLPRRGLQRTGRKLEPIRALLPRRQLRRLGRPLDLRRSPTAALRRRSQRRLRRTVRIRPGQAGRDLRVRRAAEHRQSGQGGVDAGRARDAGQRPLRSHPRGLVVGRALQRRRPHLRLPHQLLAAGAARLPRRRALTPLPLAPAADLPLTGLSPAGQPR